MDLTVCFHNTEETDLSIQTEHVLCQCVHSEQKPGSDHEVDRGSCDWLRATVMMTAE